MRYRDSFRQARKLERRELKRRGIAPTRCRRICCVRLIGFGMPAWCFAERVPKLAMTPATVWLSRRRALYLQRLAEEAGGGAVVAEAEYRVCEQCGRPLLGEDARARRRQVESCRTGRMLPCGSDCYEAQRDRRWQVKDL